MSLGMSNLFLIIQVIRHLVLCQTESNYCTYYNDYGNSQYYWPAKSNEIKTSTNDLQTSQTLKFGVGFWMSYRPIMGANVLQNPLAIESSLLKQLFVFSYTFQDSDVYSIVLYIDLSLDQFTITHNLLLLTDEGIKLFPQLMDFASYEGDWIFFYCFIDQAAKQIDINYYSVKLDRNFVQNVQEYLQLNPTMVSVTGGYKNVIDEKNNILHLQFYPGIIQPVIINFDYSIFDDLDSFLYDCWPDQECRIYSQKFIQFNATLTDEVIIKNSILPIRSYTLKGWVKLKTLGLNKQRTSVLLRISNYQYNSDNSQMGDRLLYIMYYQNSLDLEQNGFTLQTYTYTFPWRQTTYESEFSDTVYALGKEYENLITEWHYFQFEFGTLTNNGQPTYTVYFAATNTIKQYIWQKQINHFTTYRIYFSIGGDEFNPNLFQGLLSDWIFDYLCDDLAVNFQPACHYTCDKCKGITKNDCISCTVQSFRVYSESQNTCKCKFGYVDVPSNPICLLLTKYSPIFNIKEQEIVIKQGNYNKDNSNIVCLFGYFQYGDLCIQCPYQAQINLIKCADCYIYPDQFSQTLTCTFNMEAADEFQTLKNITVEADQQEYFSLQKLMDSNYSLQIKQGFQDTGSCQIGYYLTSNNDCQQCPENCLSCNSPFYCNECKDRYDFDDQGNCIFCELCPLIVKFELDEGGDPLIGKFCENGQYLSEEGCFDCGQFCSNCQQNLCYYCQDEYFLTLDLFNCAKCSIDNCKYCFQYYLSKDNVLITSLDIDQKQNIQYSEIKTACALCSEGYIFSFLTFKCELKPLSMADCESGILTDNGQLICLISETRIDAVQQTNCELENCLQCINNYSQNLNSFCVICKEGYYQSIQNGICKQCPQICATCIQTDPNYLDYWKINIRAFYHYFINSNKDHYFEMFQSQQLSVICTSCISNYFLDIDHGCQPQCDDQCLDCQLSYDFNKIFSQQQQICYECKPQTFNKQRSINSTSLKNMNYCLTCPDYCSACTSRSSSEITKLNPFFNQNSEYLKYSHLCFQFEDNNFQGNLNIIPKYLVPNICHEYEQCEKIAQMSFKLYCDVLTWYYKRKDRSDIYFSDILEQNIINDFQTSEMMEYMNQARVSQIIYNFELIKLKQDYKCFVATGMNFSNTWKNNIFTLEKTSILFWRSPKSYLENIPFLLYSGFSMINYEEITINNISFVSLSEEIEYLSNFQANISFINDYYPISLTLINSDIKQTVWKQSTILTFTSNRLQKLLIDSLDLKDLLIQDSTIFDLQPRKEYTDAYHYVNLFVVSNSSFTNSSLFLYRAEEFSLSQKKNFTNIIIKDTRFTQSFFINSTFFSNFQLGEFNLENIYLENLIFQNGSSFLQVLNAVIINVKNFTVINVKFMDESSLFVCNLISINKMLILNSIIDKGFFINIFQQTLLKRQFSITNEIYFSDISYINNTYSSINQLIRILQDDVTKVNFTGINLFLDNNYYINTLIGKQSFTFISFKQSLIYIECSICAFNNLQIFRGIGLPEISIVNSDQLEINNFHFESKKQYFSRYFHPDIECAKKYAYLDIPFGLYIYSYTSAKLNNITVKNTIIADYPIIIFFGKSQTESIRSEIIEITNSIFFNNLLFIFTQNSQASLIFVETKQKLAMSIRNVNFNQNFLHCYFLNNLDHSSTVLLINALQGKVDLVSSLFQGNTITNSSDAIIYIQANFLGIINCSFQNQNILTIDLFNKNLITLKYSTVTISNIYTDFQILAQGGNGFIEVNKLEITNTSVQNSLARNGGGFYITTLTEGVIQVKNCTFYNTSTLLNGHQMSSGGLFYIDASSSILNLTIKNCSINSSYSRTLGGAIFIEPSRSQNTLYFDDLQISSVFSIQHSFLSYSPNKQITVASSIFLGNIELQNNELGFEKYISLVTGLSSQNIELFQSDNPIIYVLFSHIVMMNCQFLNIHLANIIEIDQAYSINLKNLLFLNSTIFQSPLLKLSLMSDTKGTIMLRNIVFQNLIKQSLNVDNDCITIQVNYTKLVCPSFLSDITQKPVIQVIETDYNNQLFCNLNQLYSVSQKQNFSLILLINLNQNHQTYIDDILISHIKCSDCSYGLLSIQAFLNVLHLYVENLKMNNNNCGVLGCFTIIKTANDIDLLQASHEYQVNNGKDIVFNTILTSSFFTNNIAYYGGACFFSEIDILINNSIFENNQAIIEGGSIYYISGNTTLLIQNSQIINNSANVGGGVYIQKQQLENFSDLNLLISDNSASKFANNLYEPPRSLHLSLNNFNREENKLIFSNASTIIEQIQIPAYYPFNSQIKTDVLLLPSGISVSDYKYFNPHTNTYTSFNLTFRLQTANVYQEKVENLEDTECQIYANIKQKENSSLEALPSFTNQSTSKYLSYSTAVFNMETKDYNLDDLIIFFNPYQDNNVQLQLTFICNQIQIPHYQGKSIFPDNIIKNYILLLNIRTLQCQLGEYFNQTSGGCVLCDISQSQYSVTINSTTCQYKDETKIIDIKPAMIALRPYYWRAFYYSEIIEICHNLLANCEGGWFAGNPSCATGHLGALCEQCDLYNIKGQGSFSQNQSYQCSSCEQSIGNILNVFLVLLWTFISVLITVKSTIQMIDEFVFQLKLKPLGFHTFFQTGQTSILLKVFTNYLQIVSSITSFQLSVPIGITLAVRGVGNPIGSVAFSLDCFLQSLTKIPMIYFRIIWGFATAGMYIFLFFFLHIVLNILNKKKLNITFITTTFIYIYIYLSPNSVSDLSFLISYRNVSGQQWIAANVAYLYNTQQHKDWLIYFVTPAFLIIGVLLPLFFWYIVYYHRNQLNFSKTRRVWGYLYNEYKLSTYYWETIKIIQKELIILILIYYEDYVAIKACLIFFLLHLYGKLTSKLKPYLTENLNQIDSFSTSICKISIVLAWSIYSAQNLEKIEIVWPFYLVLALINCLFIIQMITKLIFAYFDKLYEQIDQIKALIFLNIPNQMRKNKFCQRLLQNSADRKQLVRLRFQQVRIFLISQARQIISLKKKNNMGLQSSEIMPKEHRKLTVLLNRFPTFKMLGTEVY